MSSGCGCKEVYRFPHISYPYSSCICSFLQHRYFLFIFFFLMFFVLVTVLFCNLCNNFFRGSINTHTGDYGCPTAAI